MTASGQSRRFREVRFPPIAAVTLQSANGREAPRPAPWGIKEARSPTAERRECGRVIAQQLVGQCLGLKLSLNPEHLRHSVDGA